MIGIGPSQLKLFYSVLFYSNSEELGIRGFSTFFCVSLRRSCQSFIICVTMRQTSAEAECTSVPEHVKNLGRKALGQ